MVMLQDSSNGFSDEIGDHLGPIISRFFGSKMYL